MLKPGVPPEEQELFVWDFEALTWLLSALEIGRHSRIGLVTDSRGKAFVRKAGFEWAYSGGVSTELDSIPRHVDAGVFWAAGKLFAQRVMKPPCVCMDTDLVLWQPLELESPVTVLHAEDREWAWYKADETLFKRFGFEEQGWDWTANPVNAAIVAFLDPQLREFYTDTAIGFMERYSKAQAATTSPEPPSEDVRNDPMVFAEQRLLPMCAARLRRSISYLTSAHLAGVCLYRDPKCLHLWGSKAAYRVCSEARVALVNHLIGLLLERFPRARQTLAEWKLDSPMCVEQRGMDSEKHRAVGHSGGLVFSLLRNVHGVIWIQDPNVAIRRRATEGCMVWSAEVVEPEPGASFELVVGGEDAVRFQQVRG